MAHCGADGSPSSDAAAADSVLKTRRTIVRGMLMYTLRRVLRGFRVLWGLSIFRVSTSCQGFQTADSKAAAGGLLQQARLRTSSPALKCRRSHKPAWKWLRFQPYISDLERCTSIPFPAIWLGSSVVSVKSRPVDF